MNVNLRNMVRSVQFPFILLLRRLRYNDLMIHRHAKERQ
jgi:hypothetical protein